MVNEIANIIAITLLPFLELRASIPYGILSTDLHWSIVFLTSVATNALLAPILYFFIDKAVHILLRWPRAHALYSRSVERAQTKIHPYVEKYGEIGVALFIAIPLPGSGVYSGALGSYALGLSKRRFYEAAVIGVIIAGIAVTAMTLTGSEAFRIFLKA